MGRGPSIRRIIMIVSAIAAVVQFTACATTTNRGDEHRLSGNQVARITSCCDWRSGRALRLDTLSVAGTKSAVSGEILVPSGRHDVLVTATWSNDFRDTTHLVVDVQPGKTYLVLLYELERGQDPATAEVRPGTFGEMMLLAAGAGVVQGFMVFGWPLLLLPEIGKTVPDSRPFEGCCYVWMQDAETGNVVAGTSPRTSAAK